MTQLFKTLLDAALNNILQVNYTHYSIIFYYNQRRTAIIGNAYTIHFYSVRENVVLLAHVFFHGIHRAFKNTTALLYQATHTCCSGEGNEFAFCLILSQSKIVTLICQGHNTATFRSFISHRSKAGSTNHFLLINTGSRQKVDGHAVTQGDGARLVQQEGIHIAGSLHRTAAHSQHIATQQTVHTGNADGGE